MERLTERGKDGFALQKAFTHMGEVVDRLADYEDAEERGELVRVVRCKDCAHWRGGGINEKDDFIPPMCLWHNLPTHADEYCLYGVREGEIAFAKEG